MSDDMKWFCVDWVAGPSCQVELFSPAAASAGYGYQLKYTPPFRSTIRPPAYKLRASTRALSRIKERLSELVTKLEGRSRAAAAGARPSQASEEAVLDHMKLLGDQLHTFLIRRYAQADLRTGGLFLEIGMDEALLNYPWELMHDGEDFLCLKHYVGRHVISRSPATPAQRPSSTLGSSLNTLSILLISVPNPQPRRAPGGEETVYDTLPEVEAEAKAVVDTMSGIKGVDLELLPKHKATYDNVYNALRRKQYHIIHFSGHAHFDDRNPYASGLVLFDDDMETGELESTISLKPPILCFINACETAKSVDASGAENRLDMYGLARAFLDTGAYLLGSRWKVVDSTAKVFAENFYASLIKEGKSMGEAIALSRRACKAAEPADPFGWASYVYYGDPRVCFRGLEPATNLIRLEPEPQNH